MDRMIFLAMSAAKQMMSGQAAAAHNLANANTHGFKADYAAYRAIPVFGDGFPSRVYALAERPGIDFAPGALESTGNELDVAVTSDGMLAVLAPDGSEAYTRAGDFKLDNFGQLSTASGAPVLGNSGPIALPPSEKIAIGADGTISVRPVGQEANTLAQVDRLRLVKPDLANLIKGTDGLFRTRDGIPAPLDATVTVTQGALEQSNVNPVGQMIQMIETARRYELAIKSMDTAEQMDADGARLLRMVS
ncbi:MAG: flagellar basal-body rod protein FlgF [Gammaproteobacteria bacterium]